MNILSELFATDELMFSDGPIELDTTWVRVGTRSETTASNVCSTARNAGCTCAKVRGQFTYQEAMVEFRKQYEANNSLCTLVTY